MRLHLVRHGQTASNVAHLLDTAHPGADLDEVGRAQAAALVVRLGGEAVHAIYASDLVRTQQTAAPLASALGLSVTVLGGLREIQAGDQELSPVWDAYVGVLRAWGEGTLDAALPGGEDAHSFFGRFDAAVAQIAAVGHDHAVAVTHGAALRMWVMGRVAGLDAQWAVTRPLGNTAAVVLEGDPDAGWRLVSWHTGADRDVTASADHVGPR